MELSQRTESGASSLSANYLLHVCVTIRLQKKNIAQNLASNNIIFLVLTAQYLMEDQACNIGKFCMNQLGSLTAR